MRPLALLLLATCLVAAEPRLPADRQWLVQLDLQQLAANGLGGCLDAVDRDAGLQATWTAIGGIQLRRDIERVAIVGSGGPASAVCYVWGRFDRAKLTALAESAPGHALRDHKGEVLHRWSDATAPSGESFGCLADERLLLLAQSRAEIELALDAVRGRGQTMGADDALALAMPRATDGFVLRGAAIGLDRLEGGSPESAALKRVRTLALLARRDGANLRLQLSATAANPDLAGQLSQLAQGMRAALQLDQTKRDAVTAAAIERLDVAQDGSRVDLTTAVPMATLVEAAEAAVAAHAARSKPAAPTREARRSESRHEPPRRDPAR